MPPLDRNEEERLMRIFSKMLDDRLKPVSARVDKHSGKFGHVREEIVEHRRDLSESQHETEDARTGFERMMMGVVARIEDKVDTLSTTIPPAAKAASGAEDAAVAGAKASIAGATAAIDSKTNALAAKVASHRALIVQVVVATALTAWQLIEHFVK